MADALFDAADLQNSGQLTAEAEHRSFFYLYPTGTTEACRRRPPRARDDIRRSPARGAPHWVGFYRYFGSAPGSSAFGFGMLRQRKPRSGADALIGRAIAYAAGTCGDMWW